MTISPGELAAIIFAGFIAGCIFCWGLAWQYWKRKTYRHWDSDLDDGPWWNL